MASTAEKRRYALYTNNLKKDVEGLTPDDRKFLQTVDPAVVGHRWYWVDNPSLKPNSADAKSKSVDPFVLVFNASADVNPTWVHYSHEEEKKIEELYTTHHDSTKFHPINKKYCVIFKTRYKLSKTKRYNVMAQGTIEDESNPNVSLENKRRRPVLRASFCWCRKQAKGRGDWEPLPLEVSEDLEEAFAIGLPSSVFQIGEIVWTVDFVRSEMMSQNDDVYNLKRYGTQVKRNDIQPPPVAVSVDRGHDDDDDDYNDNESDDDNDDNDNNDSAHKNQLQQQPQQIYQIVPPAPFIQPTQQMYQPPPPPQQQQQQVTAVVPPAPFIQPTQQQQQIYQPIPPPPQYAQQMQTYNYTYNGYQQAPQIPQVQSNSYIGIPAQAQQQQQPPLQQQQFSPPMMIGAGQTYQQYVPYQ